MWNTILRLIVNYTVGWLLGKAGQGISSLYSWAKLKVMKWQDKRKAKKLEDAKTEEELDKASDEMP